MNITNVTQLTAATTATSDDLLYLVDDPSGTPADKKITAANLIGSFAIAETNANDIYRVDAAGASVFVGTINGAPSGASVAYNVTSGNENAMVPTATTQLGKMRLYNTTRGTSALISNCNTGTNTITLTANAPAGWANGDTITIASQTVSGGGVNWVDIEITSGVTGRTSLFMNVTMFDTANAGIVLRIHPFETYAAPKTKSIPNQVISQSVDALALVKITGNVFSVSWNPSGASSFTFLLRLAGYLG